MRHVTALILPLFVIVVMQATLITSGIRPVFDGQLLGPDSYMRLVRVDDLMQSGDWYDRTIERSNAPFGEVLHWTRPMDVLILAVMLPLRLVMDSSAALYWAGVFVSPLLQVAAAVFLYGAGRQLFSALPAAAVATIVVAQPSVYGPFAAGRPDHHGLQLTLFAALLYFLMRILKGRNDRGSILAAAAILAAELWVSVEGLVAAAIAIGALGVPWLWHGGDRLRRNQVFAFALVAALAIVLLIDPPNEGLTSVVHDRLSAIYLFAFALVAAFWPVAGATVGARGRGARATAALAGIAFVVAVMWWVDPQILRGPYGDVDPLVKSIYLKGVAEVQPLIHDSWQKSLSEIGVWIGAGVFGIPYLAWLAVRREERERRALWLLLLAAVAVFGALTLYQLRWAGYLQVLVAMPLVALIVKTLGWIDARLSGIPRAVVRATTIVTLGTFFVVFGALVQKVAKPIDDSVVSYLKQCNVRLLAQQLDELGGATQPQRIVASHFVGPEILYRTPHEVVATAYHRNAAGILDAHAILSAAEDEQARLKVAERGITWLLICPVAAEPESYLQAHGSDSLYHRLMAGEPPRWLREIELPGDSTEFRLFKVER